MSFIRSIRKVIAGALVVVSLSHAGAASARYLSADPAGLEGGLNAYVYVLNNPLRFTDPIGLCTDPGGFGSRYCIQQYIPDKSAWGFGGDNRGASSNGGTYRASQWITHGPNGAFLSGAAPGVSTFGPFSMPGNQGPNSATENCVENCKTYTLTNSTSNGFFPNGLIAPYATHNITIKECNGNVVSVTGTHTPYPNLEIWQYGNGTPKLVYSYDKGTKGPSDISGPLVPIVAPGPK